MINLFKLIQLSIFPIIKRVLFAISNIIYIVTLGKCCSYICNKLERWKVLNRVSVIKTIYFNFRSLPLNQAKKFPILIYTNTQIISSSGKIIIPDENLRFGMIRWGYYHSFRSQGNTTINNKGTINIQGSGVFLKGCEIAVFPNARLSIKNNFFIGENVIIFVVNDIHIGNDVCISYQCDIADSDFHYTVNTKSMEIYRKSLPIKIGSYTWIGNRTTVKKGTILPPHTIVASAYCVLSKDYSKICGKYSVLGGCPAKVIKQNTSRIWYDELNTTQVIDQELTNVDKIIINKSELRKYICDEDI